jgi:16S rRNA (guanine527-N7)-methyltransferase
MESYTQQAERLFNIVLSSEQIEQFSIYEKLLLEWNKKINLTAIRDVQGIHIKHFLDSLSAVKGFNGGFPTSLIDIGTGAGLPGIPLKIAYPQIRLVLVESVGKKAKFCQLVVDSLALAGVEVIANRAEELACQSRYRERFDIAIARSVANMPVLTEYLLPLVRVGGRMIAQKGNNAHIETQSAANAIKILGGELEKIIPVELPGVSDERYLVIIKKTAATPLIYPRKAGLPVKKPILY